MKPIIIWKGRLIYMSPPKKIHSVLYPVVIVSIVFLVATILSVVIWLNWIK